MNCGSALLVLWAMAPMAASGQDIAPEVLLLSRVRDHVREELAHLPNYTCTETMQRFRKAASPGATARAVDTVRLEVLYADGKELYAPRGARQFLEEDPSKFTGTGMIGTGMFASWLHTLFVNNQATFTYRGEENAAGHRSVRWDFRVPVMASGYTITVAGASGKAGMKGSVWANPESLDLLQLSVDADDIPFGVPVMEVGNTLNYGRVRVGNTDAMLPQTAVLRMLGMTFEEETNYLEFTHCHEFRSESSLTFGPGDTPAGISAAPKAAAPVAPAQFLPKGLEVTLVLATPITGQSPAGSLITATVRGAVRSKGRVVVPEGAVVRGRIRRLDHYQEQGGYFAVGLEFTDIEAGDATVRFYADLEAIDRAPGMELTIRKPVTDLPGVGTFFVSGDRLDLPVGLRMDWKTVSASH